MLVSFSTTSLPSALARKKQRAAPTIAEDQERTAPHTQPKMAAFERVIRKAGIGAAIDWSIISMNETTAVRGPNDLRYSITTVVSSFEMVAKAVLRLFLKSANAK